MRIHRIMSTKRARSNSPSGIGAVWEPSLTVELTTTPSENSEIDSEQQKTERPPPFDAKKPDEWLDQFEKWCTTTNTSNDWIKFSLFVATQSPGTYARMQSEVRESPSRSAYEVARKYFLRNLHNENLAAVQRDNDPLPSTIETTTTTFTESVAGATASTQAIPAVETAPPPSRSIINENTVSTRSLEQLEAMLMTEIRNIRHDIEELRAMQPNTRSRNRPSARASSRNTAQPTSNIVQPTSNDNQCWYHQNYGQQARLCRSPCRHRPPTSNE